jgi:outer membrane receptor protein involved in Fe transport
VRGSVNIPIVRDESAVRASVFYRQDPGFVANTFNGAKNVNWADVEGGQLSILFRISDDLETTVSGLIQHIYGGSQNVAFLDPQTFQPLSERLTFTSPEPTNYSVDARALADTIKWNLHFATLTNIASYADGFWQGYFDFSVLPGYLGAPPGVYAYYRNESGSTRLTDELRLASSPGRLEYLLGAYYTHERDYNNERDRGTNANGQIVDPTDPFFNIYTVREDYSYHEWALFGDLTYHLTNQIEGTVGMRHAANDQSFFDNGDGVLATVNQGHKSNDSANTYLATISYKPTSTLTAYLRAASAYRPGGSQYLAIPVASVNPNYGPDSMWNYEAGVKGYLFDQRVAYSADIFDMRWKDLQLSVISSGLAYVTNVGSARSEGAEASVQFTPLKGLSVSMKGAYIDAIITADVPSINAVNGQALPFSPRWTAAAAADYRVAVASRISPTLGLTYAYHGSSSTGFTGAAGYYGAGSGVFLLSSYATLDVRGGFDWSHYSVIARVNNVTNKYALTGAGYSTGLPVAFEGIVIQPRTFGISVAAHF